MITSQKRLNKFTQFSVCRNYGLFCVVWKDVFESREDDREGGSGNGEGREALLGSVMEAIKDGNAGAGAQRRTWGREMGKMERDREGWKGKERKRRDGEEGKDLEEM